MRSCETVHCLVGALAEARQSALKTNSCEVSVIQVAASTAIAVGGADVASLYNEIMQLDNRGAGPDVLCIAGLCAFDACVRRGGAQPRQHRMAPYLGIAYFCTICMLLDS
jgi:hypothetical protein